MMPRPDKLRGIHVLCGSACLLMTAVLAGCTTLGPGDGLFGVTLISRDDERRIGARSHPEIVERFGGIYRNRKLEARLARLVGRLVMTGAESGARYRLSVLDTKSVNAFALPGGYLYVTRGLLALVNSDAELAHVLAHELSHITARHAAKQHTERVKAELLGPVLALISGTSQARARLGREAYLAQYSRDQEFEADIKGIKIAASAGFNVAAASDFLRALKAHIRLQAKFAPRLQAVVRPKPSHPALQDRIDATRRAARRHTADGARGGMTGRLGYLNAIDGMLFGARRKDGFIRANRFIHPVLRFEFAVPKRFVLHNAKNAVLAYGPPGSLVFFDGVTLAKGASLENYFRRSFAQGLEVRDIKRGRINQTWPHQLNAHVDRPGGAQVLSIAAGHDQIRQKPRISLSAGRPAGHCRVIGAHFRRNP
jgi:predicted Zn-dependent protease